MPTIGERQVEQVKVTVITEIISPYRIPLFNHLTHQPGIELLVVFLRKNVPDRLWEPSLENIAFEYTILPGWNRTRGPLASPVYISRGMRDTLASFNPDVVITGGYHHSAALSALAYTRKRAKLILWAESTLQDRRPRSSILHAYKRFYVRRADRFLVPGIAAREFLVSLGALAEDIWIAPNSVDDRLFSGVRKEPSGRFTVLYVGRLVPHKRVSDLIIAFAPLDRAGARLVIVGSGPEEEKLRRIARDKGIQNVAFKGFHQPQGLPDTYAQADVLVLPTEHDPWGLVINEAMTSSLPVLASRAAGAARDLVVEGQTGYTFDPGDINTLADLLGRLASNREHVRQMGHRARQLVEYCSPERSARGFAEAATVSPNSVFSEFAQFHEAMARGDLGQP